MTSGEIVYILNNEGESLPNLKVSPLFVFYAIINFEAVLYIKKLSKFPGLHTLDAKGRYLGDYTCLLVSFWRQYYSGFHTKPHALLRILCK